MLEWISTVRGGVLLTMSDFVQGNADDRPDPAANGLMHQADILAFLDLAQVDCGSVESRLHARAR